MWEWDIVSDSLFLSKGALEALGMDERPRSMKDFYAHMPGAAATELAAAREDIIAGKTGASSACGYICRGKWVEERAVPLMRNREGRATRIMGHMSITNMCDRLAFRASQTLLADAGQWLYKVSTGQIWHDEVCDRIIGNERPASYPINRKDSIFAVHPSERAALRRHYELFCGGRELGDTITDIVRVKMPGGDYNLLVVRATAMQRDENGRAVIVAGLIAPGEPVKKTLESLKADDRLYHALNSMGIGQWNWDTREGAIYFCPRYLAMLGYGQDDSPALKNGWEAFIHPDDLDKVAKVREQVIAGPEHGESYECTYRMRRADGGWAWVFDRGYVTWREANGRAGHMIGSITNITTAQEERDRLEELVRHDALTGLRSRAFCNLEIEHIRQNEIRPVSAISVDITGLKMVNDYLGHARGDELLTRAASIMRGALRRSDCIGRMGGDEFVVLLPGCDKEKSKKVMAKLVNAFKAYNDSGPSMPVFAAIGCASAETLADSLEDMFEEADEHMYEDKRQHRREAHAVLKNLIFQMTGQTPGGDDRLD